MQTDRVAYKEVNSVRHTHIHKQTHTTKKKKDSPVGPCTAGLFTRLSEALHQAVASDLDSDLAVLNCIARLLVLPMYC